MLTAYACLVAESQRATNAGLFSTVEESAFDGISVGVSAAADPAVKAAFAGLTGSAVTKGIIFFIFAQVVIVSATVHQGAAPLLGKISIPKNGFGTPTSGDNPPPVKCNGLPNLTPESVSRMGWLIELADSV